MIPTQAHQGHYWKTNDAADLPFNEAGSEQPQAIRCYNMQDHLNRGECRNVPVATLYHFAVNRRVIKRPDRKSTGRRSWSEAPRALGANGAGLSRQRPLPRPVY